MLETLTTIGIMAQMSLSQSSFDYPSLGENVEDRDNQQERLVRLVRLTTMIECEGHITIGMAPSSSTRDRLSLYPTVGFTNTDPALFNEVCQTLRSENVGFNSRNGKSRGVGSKPRFDVSIHGYQRVLDVLNLIEPFLKTKKEQAKILRNYVERRIGKKSHKAKYQEIDWQQCKAIRLLNKRMPNAKALAKVKALLESPESIRHPHRIEYLRAYVKMCSELQRELQKTAETPVSTV